MKLIVFPLAVLVVISLLSMTGLGETGLGDITIGGDSSTTVYYDSGGHALIYANGTFVGEDGIVTNAPTWGADYAYWDNGSILLYEMYWDNAGSEQLLFADFGSASPNVSGIELSLGGSLGLIVLIVGVMALAVVVGLRILGSGTSDVSVGTVVLGTSYLGVWGVFSVLALDLVVAGGDLFLPIIYFVLTAIYCVGIVGQIGGSNGD